MDKSEYYIVSGLCCENAYPTRPQGLRRRRVRVPLLRVRLLHGEPTGFPRCAPSSPGASSCPSSPCCRPWTTTSPARSAPREEGRTVCDRHPLAGAIGVPPTSRRRSAPQHVRLPAWSASSRSRAPTTSRRSPQRPHAHPKVGCCVKVKDVMPAQVAPAAEKEGGAPPAAEAGAGADASLLEAMGEQRPSTRSRPLRLAAHSNFPVDAARACTRAPPTLRFSLAVLPPRVPPVRAAPRRRQAIPEDHHPYTASYRTVGDAVVLEYRAPGDCRPSRSLELVITFCFLRAIYQATGKRCWLVFARYSQSSINNCCARFLLQLLHGDPRVPGEAIIQHCIPTVRRMAAIVHEEHLSNNNRDAGAGQRPRAGRRPAVIRKDQGADALARARRRVSLRRVPRRRRGLIVPRRGVRTRAAHARLRVRLELTTPCPRPRGARGAREGRAAAPPALRLTAALAGDAAGARALARRGARHPPRRPSSRRRPGRATPRRVSWRPSSAPASPTTTTTRASSPTAPVFRRTLRGAPAVPQRRGLLHWPSAAVLASLAPQEIPAGARVLELGAGTGLAGLVFASRALCGAVTLSDRKELA